MGTYHQRLVDTKMGGRLRERVEELRTQPGVVPWRDLAVIISRESGESVGFETLRRWAKDSGWRVNDDPEQAAS